MQGHQDCDGGDEVVIQASPVESIGPGDVIAYRYRDVLIVHRVVAVRTGPDGARVVWEKGDANMYLAGIPAADVLGVVTEVVADGRRLPLRSARFRVLGRAVVRWGTVSVRAYDVARRVGQRLLPAGSPVLAAGRRAVYGLLQCPARAALGLARRVF